MFCTSHFLRMNQSTSLYLPLRLNIGSVLVCIGNDGRKKSLDCPIRIPTKEFALFRNLFSVWLNASCCSFPLVMMQTCKYDFVESGCSQTTNVQIITESKEKKCYVKSIFRHQQSTCLKIDRRLKKWQNNVCRLRKSTNKIKKCPEQDAFIIFVEIVD